MAESFPETISDRADDAGKYQPLAPLAIAATIVAGLLAFTTVSLLLIGLIAGKRVLEAPLIVGALIGVVLSAAARFQIRRSEGARSGNTLANVSWWTSLVCGLVYGAYYLGTMLSIRAQAQDFLDAAWYPALQQREIDKAFFFTRTPVDRNKRTEREVIERFEDHYTFFKNTELVHLLERAGDGIAVEPESFTNEEEKQQAMVLTQPFWIRTREGRFKCSASVIRANYPDLEGAQYHVNPANPSVLERRPSVYGRLVREVTAEGNSFIRDWTGRAALPNNLPMQLDMQDLPESRRKQILSEYLAASNLQQAFATATAPHGGLSNALNLAALWGENEVNRTLLIPREYVSTAMNLTTVVEAPEDKGTAIAEHIRKILFRGPYLSVPSNASGEVPAIIQINGNQIRVRAQMDCRIPPLALSTDAIIEAEIRSPELIAEMNRLRQLDWKQMSEQEENAPGYILDRYPRHWVITQVQIDLTRRASSDPIPANPNVGPGPIGPRPKKR